jgi:hypothetical protein
MTSAEATLIIPLLLFCLGYFCYLFFRYRN